MDSETQNHMGEQRLKKREPNLFCQHAGEVDQDGGGLQGVGLKTRSQVDESS